MGFWGVLALIALRLTIGWHFFQEGIGKVRDGGFSSAGFFRQAKGPLAGTFHSLLPVGEARLWLDGETTEARWKTYRDGLTRKYRFDASQTEQANQVLASHLDAVRKYFRGNKDDILEYVRRLDALHEAKSDPAVRALPSFGEHVSRNETEISQLPGDLVAGAKDFWRSLELQLLAIRTDEQKTSGDYPILASGRLWSIETIDPIVPYFDLTIGVLLMVGLLTRVASLSGALFLFMIMATQPPWVTDAMPIHNQLVEAVGLLVLAGTAAGRFAGFDFFLSALTRRNS